jgi:hypothetical protein
MMTPTETGMLLAKISTYDNRQLTAEAIDSWCESLKPYVNVMDAKQAAVEFYGDPRWAENARRPWIMPADINARCAAIRSKRLPDEATIGAAVERLHSEGVIGDDDSWDVRRLAIPLIQDGRPLEAALREAARRIPKRLTSAPAKPSKPAGHHFAGNRKISDLSINQVLGRESS